MALTAELADATFAKDCNYFIAIQLTGSSEVQKVGSASSQ
jgi:hypothetical protein